MTRNPRESHCTGRGTTLADLTPLRDNLRGRLGLVAAHVCFVARHITRGDIDEAQISTGSAVFEADQAAQAGRWLEAER